MRRQSSRRRGALLVAAAVVTLGVGACYPQVAQPSAASPRTTERIAAELLDQVNAERATRGLSALRWDPDLAGVAAAWSDHLAVTGTFQHRDLSALFRLEPFRHRHSALGENILRGPASVRSGSMTVAWMRSTGHRHNLLSPGFDSIGIGVTCRDGMVYVTQNFGRHVSSRRSLATDAGENPIVTPSAQGSRC